MKLRSIITAALCMASFSSLAINVNVGETVPAIGIEAKGEIFIEADDFTYQPWHSDMMIGKVRVIQAIAGRTSSKALNKPLMDALVKENLNPEVYQTTTIVNQDDAIWGTSSFVKSSLEDSKEEFPHSSMVLDPEGDVANLWELKEDDSAIIVQDKQGKVLWIKEGALTEQEIEAVLKLISENI